MAVCTLGLLATSIYGITQLDIDFNPVNFLKVAEDEYQKRFLEAEKLFNKQGEGGIFMANLNYSSQAERGKIATLVRELEALDRVEFEQSWLSANLPPPLQRQPDATGFPAQSSMAEEASMIPFKFFIPHTTSEGMLLLEEMDALIKAQVASLHLATSTFHHQLPRSLTLESLSGCFPDTTLSTR